jgi:hypothetical protein
MNKFTSPERNFQNHMEMKHYLTKDLRKDAYEAPCSEELSFGTGGMLCASLEGDLVDPGQGEDWGDL